MILKCVKYLVLSDSGEFVTRGNGRSTDMGEARLWSSEAWAKDVARIANNAFANRDKETPDVFRVVEVVILPSEGE